MKFQFIKINVFFLCSSFANAKQIKNIRFRHTSDFGAAWFDSIFKSHHIYSFSTTIAWGPTLRPVSMFVFCWHMQTHVRRSTYTLTHSMCAVHDRLLVLHQLMCVFTVSLKRIAFHNEIQYMNCFPKWFIQSPFPSKVFIVITHELKLVNNCLYIIRFSYFSTTAKSQNTFVKTTKTDISQQRFRQLHSHKDVDGVARWFAAILLTKVLDSFLYAVKGSSVWKWKRFATLPNGLEN